MPEIIVDNGRCTGCGECGRFCPFSALSVDNGRALIDVQSCQSCGICIKHCPQSALHAAGKETALPHPAEYSGVWIFGELEEGRLLPVVHELLGKGRELAGALEQELSLVVLGHRLEDVCKIKNTGADNLLAITDVRLAGYPAELCAEVLQRLVEQRRPAIFLAGATAQGRSLFPRLAVLCQTGLTADCTALEIRRGELVQIRPALGGNILAEIVCPGRRPQMATVRPGVFAHSAQIRTPEVKIANTYSASSEPTSDAANIYAEHGENSADLAENVSPGDSSAIISEESCTIPAAPSAESPAEVRECRFIDMSELVRLCAGPVGEELAFAPADKGAGCALSRAEVVVCGGRGVGSAEGFTLLEELAQRLGGAVGASRAAVEAGWYPYARQIGQTGCTVAPELYLCFGVSGAVQHRAGIGGARRIIAVNTDPEAPICSVADYVLAGDWRQVAQGLLGAFRDSTL